MKKSFLFIFALIFTGSLFAQDLLLTVRKEIEKEYGFKSFDLLKYCEKPKITNASEVKIGKNGRNLFVCYSLFKDDKEVKQYSSDNYASITLYLMDKTSNHISQKIECKDNAAGYCFYDANFDGYQDLLFFLNIPDGSNKVNIHLYNKETNYFESDFIPAINPYFYKAKKLIIQAVSTGGTSEGFVVSSCTSTRIVPVASVSYEYSLINSNLVVLQFIEYEENPNPVGVYNKSKGTYDVNYYIEGPVKKVTIPSNYESLTKNRRKEILNEYNSVVNELSGIFK